MQNCWCHVDMTIPSGICNGMNRRAYLHVTFHVEFEYSNYTLRNYININ